MVLSIVKISLSEEQQADLWSGLYDHILKPDSVSVEEIYANMNQAIPDAMQAIRDLQIGLGSPLVLLENVSPVDADAVNNFVKALNIGMKEAATGIDRAYENRFSTNFTGCWHQDDATFFTMYCEKGHPAAATDFCSVEGAISHLEDSEREHLFGNNFSLKGFRPLIPVVVEDKAGNLRLPYMGQISLNAQKSLTPTLKIFVGRNYNPEYSPEKEMSLVLKDNDFLIVDNERVVHHACHKEEIAEKDDMDDRVIKRTKFLKGGVRRILKDARNKGAIEPSYRSR